MDFFTAFLKNLDLDTLSRMAVDADKRISIAAAQGEDAKVAELQKAVELIELEADIREDQYMHGAMAAEQEMWDGHHAEEREIRSLS